MRLLVFLCCLFLASSALYAQGDFPTTRRLDVNKDKDRDIQNSNVGTQLPMPSIVTPNLGRNETQGGVKMLPDRNLKQAGHDLKIDPKLSVLEGGNSNKFHGDMYLGDVKTRSKFVGIAVRDHGEIDGDRVMIFVNGEITHYNQVLGGRFLELKVPLREGFNTIEFQALNQGYTGLNTAQLLVTEESGEVIHDNSWYLSTGSKATAVVIKEPEIPEGFRQ